MARFSCFVKKRVVSVTNMSCRNRGGFCVEFKNPLIMLHISLSHKIGCREGREENVLVDSVIRGNE